MGVKFTYRNFPSTFPLNPFLTSHTLENMKDNGLGKIFNVQAYELETGKNLDVFISGVINRSVLGSYQIIFSVTNVNNEIITDEKTVNVVGGSRFFDDLELVIFNVVTLDNYSVTDLSDLFADKVFDNEESASIFCSTLLDRFTFYDSQGYKTIGCGYCSDGSGGLHLVDLSFSIYLLDSNRFCVSFRFFNLNASENVACLYLKTKNIDTTVYNKSEIDSKISFLSEKISSLETSLGQSTQENTVTFDSTQFSDLKSLLQGIAVLGVGK